MADSGGGGVDWTRIHQRLSELKAGEAPRTRRRGAMESLVRRRAEKLSQAHAAIHAPIEPYLLFILADEPMALACRYIREILNPTAIVPLPHSLPALIGVCNNRGRILPVFDVRGPLGKPAVGPLDVVKLLVIGEAGPEFAMPVQRVVEVRNLDASAPAPEKIGDHRMIDGPALLAHPDLFAQLPTTR